MIVYIGLESPDTQKSKSSMGTSAATQPPSWKRLLSCTNRRLLHKRWLESHRGVGEPPQGEHCENEPGALPHQNGDQLKAYPEDRSALQNIVLYEYRPQSAHGAPTAAPSDYHFDIGFLLGYLFRRSASLIVVVLHSGVAGSNGGSAASSQADVVQIHNAVFLDSACALRNSDQSSADGSTTVYYPDIVLAHPFAEAPLTVCNPFFSALYTNLSTLVSPHRLLGISLDRSADSGEQYRGMHAFLRYMRQVQGSIAQFAPSADPPAQGAVL